MLASPWCHARTLEEVQAELALTKAELDLVNARLALASAQQQLAAVGGLPRSDSARPASHPAATDHPSLVELVEAKPIQRSTNAPVRTRVTTNNAADEASSSTKPSPTPSALDAATDTLRRAGIAQLNRLLPLQRDALLGGNGVPPDAFASFNRAEASKKPLDVKDALLAKRVPLEGDKRKNNPGESDAAEIERLHQDRGLARDAHNDLAALDTLLVTLGFQIEKERARNAGGQPDTTLAAAATRNGRHAIVEIPNKSPDDVALRNAGISFSQGFGIAFSPSSKGDDASVGVLLARWNWLQRSAAGKWNRWVGQNNAEGDAQVPYRGKIEYWLGWKDYTDGRPPERRERTWPELTALGPFLGTAVVGEKVKFGANEERPWLVGISTGLGFYKDAASLLYIDAGVTVSPKSGFDHSHFYGGISLDGILLGKMLGLTRNAHLPTDTGK